MKLNRSARVKNESLKAGFVLALPFSIFQDEIESVRLCSILSISGKNIDQTWTGGKSIVQLGTASSHPKYPQPHIHLSGIFGTGSKLLFRFQAI